jgi:hypothetical protein
MRRLGGATAIALVVALAACGGGGDAGSTSGPPGPVNRVPTVDAGAVQYVVNGSTVTLSGVAADADGDALTYSWSLVAKQPGVLPALANAASPTASFVAESLQPGAVYTATLAVSDGTATSSASTTVVATPLGISLIEVDLFGAEKPALFPYNRRPTQNITTSDPVVTLARFKLVVQGPGQFTIQSLQVGLAPSGYVLSFGGLLDGQVLSAGPPVAFALQSNHTLGQTLVTATYQFNIAEVPLSGFDYRSTLTTN